MGAVAQRAVAALLAAAKVNRRAFDSGVFLRRELGALMAAVAKRLRLALAATAPVVILAILDFDGEWGFACDLRSAHNVFSFYWLEFGDVLPDITLT
jgi:hypothetical protein